MNGVVVVVVDVVVVVVVFVAVMVGVGVNNIGAIVVVGVLLLVGSPP